MRSANRHALIVTGALLLLVAIACIAAAGAKANTVVDQAQLRASADVQKWESVPLSGRVFVSVFVGKVEVEQSGYRGCGANYSGAGLFVWLKLTGCKAPGRHPAEVRYLSVRGEQPFTVKITRQPILDSPF